MTLDALDFNILIFQRFMKLFWWLKKYNIEDYEDFEEDKPRHWSDPQPQPQQFIELIGLDWMDWLGDVGTVKIVKVKRRTQRLYFLLLNVARTTRKKLPISWPRQTLIDCWKNSKAPYPETLKPQNPQIQIQISFQKTLNCSTQAQPSPVKLALSLGCLSLSLFLGCHTFS